MNITDNTIEKIKELVDRACEKGRISDSERLLSIIAGGFIVTYSIKRILKNPISSISFISIGGALLVRGVTGKCAVKGALPSVANEEEVTHTVVEHRYFVK